MWLVNNVGFPIDTTRVDVSYKIFNDYFHLPIHQEGEVVIHYNDSVRAVEAIQRVVTQNDIPVNYITEVCRYACVLFNAMHACNFNTCVLLTNDLTYTVVHALQVRFVKGDEIHLSPQNGHDPGTCAITLTIYAPEYTALNYFDKVYDAMRNEGLNARFHWGKHFNHDHEEIGNLYPDLEEFAQLRKQMDPKDIFLNEFLEETFRFKDNKL